MAMVIRFHETGGPEVLRREEMDVPDRLLWRRVQYPSRRREPAGSERL
jgi:hypothetical protein